MGKTISITLPEPVEKYFRDLAKKNDVSRSKEIRKVLVSIYEKVKEAEIKKYGNAPNKCIHRNRNGTCECEDFNFLECNAPEQHAKTCSKYRETS